MIVRFGTAALLVSGLAFSSAGAQAHVGQNTQRGAQCQAHFNANKTAIEALAASGDVAGIKTIMNRGTCPTGMVKLPAQAGTKAAGFTVECKTFQIYPDVRIECTFSLLTRQKTEKR